jgi:hypothetical protein
MCLPSLELGLGCEIVRGGRVTPNHVYQSTPTPTFLGALSERGRNSINIHTSDLYALILNLKYKTLISA